MERREENIEWNGERKTLNETERGEHRIERREENIEQNGERRTLN